MYDELELDKLGDRKTALFLMAASLPGLVTDTGRAFAVEEPIPIHVQQVINGGKVTDHHALLPTKSMANADLAALPAGERNVLRLIAARLLCAVGEPHCYARTPDHPAGGV